MRGEGLRYPAAEELKRPAAHGGPSRPNRAPNGGSDAAIPQARRLACSAPLTMQSGEKARDDSFPGAPLRVRNSSLRDENATLTGTVYQSVTQTEQDGKC
jgi:hypothetical protein